MHISNISRIFVFNNKNKRKIVMKKEVLEPSTNTHTLEAEAITKTDVGNGIIKLNIKGDGIVTHGEHGTLTTESENVIKYVQQEVNPISKKMQNAFD